VGATVDRMATVLVTGAAGYIGSHVTVALAAAGHRPVMLDDLSRSRPEAIARIRRLAGGPVPFHHADVADRAALDRIAADHRPSAVVHLAGFKSVAESVREPLRYHRTNIGGFLVLAAAMADHGWRTLVVSSSATVYGDAGSGPVDEHAALRPANPYGTTKRVIEDLCGDLARADPRLGILLLRYFNPVGAHPSAIIGEDPLLPPTNLVPAALDAAAGTGPALTIHGDDWPTPDGTGVRDYLHVMDLATAHVRAVERAEALGGCRAVNLGTGRGHSVREVLAAVERAVGRPLPVRTGPRRPGDVAACWADPTLAETLLGWRAERGLDAMVADAWRWRCAAISPSATP
jgi:UDP-glucose 4-epimerase